MSIPALRTPAPVTSGLRPGPLTITIHHSKLAQFLQSERKIGTLACRDWNTRLEQRFAYVSQMAENIDFRRFFPDLQSLLTADKNLTPARRPEDEQRHAIQLQFRSAFPDKVARELGQQFIDLLPAYSVFMELRGLQAKIDRLQAEGRSIGEQLKTSNRILAKMSERYPVKFVIY